MPFRIDQAMVVLGEEVEASLTRYATTVSNLWRQIGWVDFITPDLFLPVLPRVVRKFAMPMFDAATDLISDWSVIPVRTLIRIASANVTWPRRLHNTVMPCDKAAQLVLRVLIDDSIGTINANLPVEWRLFEASKKIEKWLAFIRVPGIIRAIKAMLGGVWGRVIRLIWILARIAGVVFVAAIAWRFLKVVQDPVASRRLFDAALAQDSAKEKRVTLYRHRVNLRPGRDKPYRFTSTARAGTEKLLKQESVAAN